MTEVNIWWLEALTLEERLELRRRTPQICSDGDAALGRRRMQRWREKAGLEDDALFLERLGSTRSEDFAMALTESAGLLARRAGAPPEWLLAILELMPGTEAPRYDWRAQAGSDPYALFTEAVGPLVDHALSRLEQGLPDLFGKGFESDFLYPLLFGLHTSLFRVIALKLEEAREAGNLRGDTPQERFQNYMLSFREPEQRKELWLEFPVLARHCWQLCENWLHANLEFAGRLRDDMVRLGQVYGVSGPVTRLRLGLGDAHCQGRQSAIVTFGNGRKVVYKPRCLALEDAFQSLLNWLNEHGLQPAQRTLQVVQRPGYGWMEYVDHQHSADPEAIDRFYRREGALLAILYALRATDMHAENVIAEGEHPVAVDLEALFHPQAVHPAEDAEGVAWESFKDSLLSVGLLPVPESGRGGVDFSALGGSEDQYFPLEMPTMENEGTDQFRVRRTRHKLGSLQNRTTLEIGERPWKQAFLSGFEDGYNLLWRQRAELPLSAFGGARVRCLLRNTQSYASLLMEASHPDFLRSALPRDLLFDVLWSEAPRSASLIPFIPAEQRQLCQGDIPYFWCRPESVETIDPDRSIRSARSDYSSGLEVAHRRLARMGLEDRERQLWFLEGALADLPGPPPLPREQPNHDPVQAIRDYLAKTAFHHGDTCSWLSHSVGSEMRHEFGVTGSDLYSGLPGILFFLAYCQDPLSAPAERMLERKLDSHPPPGMGAFSGWGGILYLWTHLGRLWQRPDLFARALERVALLQPESETQLDVTAGLAGGILSLLALHHTQAHPSVLEMAVRCGEQLIRVGTCGAEGFYWDMPVQRGLSHGTAGLGWALVALGQAADRPDLVAHGLQAFRWEDHLLRQGRWTDHDPNAPVLNAWCHGAAGIALTRLQAWRLTHHAWLLDTARLALDEVVQRRPTGDPILCHGDLGNLDTLRLAGQLFPDETRWAFELEQRSAAILGTLKSREVAAFLPGRVAIPGLLTGLAGVGYGLMRALNPTAVPSLLSLEPPGR